MFWHKGLCRAPVPALPAPCSVRSSSFSPILSCPASPHTMVVGSSPLGHLRWVVTPGSVSKSLVHVACFYRFRAHFGFLHLSKIIWLHRSADHRSNRGCGAHTSAIRFLQADHEQLPRQQSEIFDCCPCGTMLYSKKTTHLVQHR